MKNKFTERFAELIRESGKSQTVISEELGVRKQKLSNWKTGYIEPNIDDLILIATYFHVTIDYLVGLDSDLDSNKKSSEELEYTTTSLKYRRK